MTAAEPIEAVATDGIVAIFVDPATAARIADAWEFTYASGGLDDTHRPAYLLDCAALKNAAIQAAQQAADEPDAGVRYVPVLDVPTLRLVRGGA